MRGPADKEKIENALVELGKRATGPGRVYLVGGSSTVLQGDRLSTIDLDLKLDPEPEGAFEAIATIKQRLDLNIELASPDQFIPELPGWKERSPFIRREGLVDFHHYDFYSQALAKLERSHPRDLSDVEAWAASGTIDLSLLTEYFSRIEARLVRYPSIDAASFRQRVEQFVER